MGKILRDFEGKRERNKSEKRIRLMDSAYELFSTKGFANTSIEQITKNAGVAKGTFYSFFKDKFEIRNHLAAKEAITTFREAYESYNFDENEDQVESFISFIDYILNQLEENKDRLKIINKNLSLGVFKDFFEEGEGSGRDYDFIDELFERFSRTFAGDKYSKEQMPLLLFSIIEMVGGVGYFSISEEIPRPIGEMKPVLYQNIRLMLQ